MSAKQRYNETFFCYFLFHEICNTICFKCFICFICLQKFQMFQMFHASSHAFDIFYFTLVIGVLQKFI
jgi:hypothetical protein